jgi:hypothetical protein
MGGSGKITSPVTSAVAGVAEGVVDGNGVDADEKPLLLHRHGIGLAEGQTGGGEPAETVIGQTRALARMQGGDRRRGASEPPQGIPASDAGIRNSRKSRRVPEFSKTPDRSP